MNSHANDSDAGEAHPAPEGTLVGFADLAAGAAFPPLHVTVPPAANARYLAGASVDHRLFAGGVLYPPIAANLTVLAFGGLCPDPVIQTRQVLRCAGLLHAGTPLVVTGEVVAAYDKRGRRYVDVRAAVAPAASPADIVWASEVSFTPAAGFGR